MYKILSIDGGGTKGIVPATFLNELHRKSKKIVHQHYDSFAGTSTGAIIAAALALEFNTDEIIKLYHEGAPRIFKKEKKWWQTGFGLKDEVYEKENLIEELEKHFGDAKMKDVKKHLVVTAYDIVTEQPIYFDSQTAEHRDLRIVDCVASSASAPTYFEPIKFNDYVAVDGGVAGMNNPSLVAIKSALKMGHKLDKLSVLTVGTGETSKELTYRKAKNFGVAQWAKPLVSIMITAPSKVMNDFAKYLIEPADYYRLNIDLSPHRKFTLNRIFDGQNKKFRLSKPLSAMDAPENMKVLENLVRLHCNENTSDLQEIIDTHFVSQTK